MTFFIGSSYSILPLKKSYRLSGFAARKGKNLKLSDFSISSFENYYRMIILQRDLKKRLKNPVPAVNFRVDGFFNLFLRIRENGRKGLTRIFDARWESVFSDRGLFSN